MKIGDVLATPSGSRLCLEFITEDDEALFSLEGDSDLRVAIPRTVAETRLRAVLGLPAQEVAA